MTENVVRRIVVVDFEASSLPGPGSYPIEVAAGIPETGEIRSWLIRPEPVWLESWVWDPESERIHRLTREHLLAHGLPRAQVARELEAFIGGREVVSDNPRAEGYWLGVLFGEQRPRSVGWLSLLYEAIMAGTKAGHQAYSRTLTIYCSPEYRASFEGPDGRQRSLA